MKLLGTLDGAIVRPTRPGMSAHCNRVAVEDGHTECVSHQAAQPATREQMLAAWSEFQPLAGITTCHGPRAAGRVCRSRRPPAAAPRPHARRRHGRHRRPSAPLQSAGLEVHRALAQHHPRRCRCGPAQRRNADEARQAQQATPRVIILQTPAAVSGMKLVVMKFGGTSVEDAAAIDRTAAIVAGRIARGLQPVVVVSAMAKRHRSAAAAAAAAGRGDKLPAHSRSASRCASATSPTAGRTASRGTASQPMTALIASRLRRARRTAARHCRRRRTHPAHHRPGRLLRRAPFQPHGRRCLSPTRSPRPRTSMPATASSPTHSTGKADPAGSARSPNACANTCFPCSQPARTP